MNAMMKDTSPAQYLLALFPVAIAFALLRFVPEPSLTDRTPDLARIVANEAAELEAVFESIGYRWPPVAAGNETRQGVPPVAVDAMPADLHTLSVDARKALFFRVLAPLVAAENRALIEQREFLLKTFAQWPRLPESGAVASRVRAIASRFNVAGNLDRPENRRTLLRRVDIVPAPLVLAQAANESGWGTSRFTREANNLFGMWTWDSNAGIAPMKRAAHAKHFVRVFDDLRAAVANYLHTINVGPAYRDLRDLRAAQRDNGETLDALGLAAGLRRYSARGEDYVREIRSIIEYNDLDDLPPLEIIDDANGR